MNDGREIYFWHGWNKEIYDILYPICVETQLSDGQIGLVYYDSLDDFAKHYDRPFMVIGDWIAVTHHTSFNQR